MSCPEKVTIEKERIFFRRNELHEKMWVIFYVVLSLSLMTLDYKLHRLEEVKFFVGSCVKPFQESLMKFLELPYRVSSAFANAMTNAQKVSELSRELSRQKVQEAYTSSLKEQNDNLSRILKLNNENHYLHSITAQIIKVGLNPFITELTLNKGLSDGIALGNPVINEQGLIGQVTRLYQHYAEVTLLSAINQETPVEILPSGVTGITVGRGKSLSVILMPQNSNIEPGNTVVTSGIDGLYPRHIRVGTIISVVKNSNANTVEATTEPIATEKLSPYVIVIPSRKVIQLGEEKLYVAQKSIYRQ
ncbi:MULTISPECIES: rod shape-determining protein MreC [Candidatus Ichthyocystis]|uniref:Cell shape-determining protein MreC n=1 Tax=Candidatus Ichthyocystis hellenicum TaxID=1561003 RepID=A0A0S4M4M4_9BURK|nr:MULTISPECIES: rod shape-determining protein MreC [Ichthyocystis]CUT17254.1 rod shape-determining protein MreC [Candidatus Ichthyocystis hellenicum]